MNKRKLLIYCDCKNKGGVLTFTVELCRALKCSGYEIGLVTHRPEGDNQIKIAEELSADSNCVYLIDRQVSINSSIYFFDNIAKEFEPDFFVPNYRAGAFASSVKIAGQKVKVIGVCHNDANDSYSILTRYESVISAFICPANSSYNNLGKLMPQRKDDIFLVPHCVRFEPKVLADPIPSQPIRLVYHGRIDELQKQLNLVPELGQKLDDKGINYHITLVGDGNYLPQLKERVHDYGLSDKVSFLPPMDWSELVKELPRHHYSLLLSRYEGFCLSLAEAMGLGLPALAFRCNGTLETYVEHGKNGFLVDDGDLDKMAEILAVASRDTEAYSVMSDYARKSVRDNLAFEKFKDNYCQIMGKVFGRTESFGNTWPKLRPVYVDSSSKLYKRAMERTGKLLGLWR